MKPGIHIAIVSALLLLPFAGVVATPPESAQTAADMAPAQRAELVKKYCVTCHQDRMKSGGFSFSTLDPSHPDANAEQAEKVIRKLRTGLMPPAGMPRPDAKTLESFVSSLENDIDRVAAVHPNPGRPFLHRLNRTEYQNSVRDLLDLDVDVNSLLPADDASHGFDNIAEALNISPTLMEAYVRAASKISRLAVGEPQMKPVVETYHVAQTFSQLRHVEGTPFGTRGGIAVVHTFPADGEYVFKGTLYFTSNTFLFGSTGHDEQLEIAVNGERVALLNVNPMMKVDEDLRTPPIKVKAGPQTISAAFIKKADGPVDDFVQPYERSLGDTFTGQIPGLTSLPHLQDIGIVGPYQPSGVSETPSRAKIFSCRPTRLGEEEGCARKIFWALGRQAYRQPLSDNDLNNLMTAFRRGRNGGDFETGIQQGLELMVASPQFVFRFERRPASVTPGSDYRLNDYELASRLSFFLWSGPPDSVLLDLANKGKLRDAGVLEQQVRRMIKDPRAGSLATNFAAQWLFLRNLKSVQPDIILYPDSDENLFSSMRRETEMFFESMIQENRNVIDLLTANYTFVNERLAKHYGIPNVMGNQFRRVTLTDPNRFGLLGQGAILTVTSYSSRTSPVVRGKWVLEQMLGATVPVPPPNVPTLPENEEGVTLRTVRDRLEQHRSQEPCMSCHKIMDPIGLSLENFDAIGAWRTEDSGYPVDTAGQMADGTKLNGPQSLRQALLSHSTAFVDNLTAKLLTYALGRGVEAPDMPTVRAIAHEAAKDDNRFDTIIMGIVKSTPFQMRRAEPVPATPVTSARNSTSSH